LVNNADVVVVTRVVYALIEVKIPVLVLEVAVTVEEEEEMDDIVVAAVLMTQ